MSGTLTSGRLILTDTNGNSDAFDRLRVSKPKTLYEIHHTFSKEPRLIDEFLSGSGASAHSATGAYVAMTTSSGVAGKVIRQSYEYIPYQPGKSKLMLFTGILEMAGGVADSISRMGCFDASTDKSSVAGTGNGHFFELNGTTMNVVERLNNVDTTIAQASWNVDAFDGSGPSGFTISGAAWGKSRIFAVDQEWLGVGVVRMGLFINGAFKEGHRFNHSGVGTPSSTAITAPYTKMAKLPIRYEIVSTADTVADSEMRMMCSTVLSEGGFEPVGRIFAFSGHTEITVDSASVFEPLFSLRLVETEPSNRASIILKNIHLINISGASKYAHFHLFLLDASSKITGGSWVNPNESVGEYNSTATAVNTSGAISVGSGYIEIKTSEEFPYENYLNSPIINSAIDGTSKVLCIAAVKLGANVGMYGGMEWIEVK